MGDIIMFIVPACIVHAESEWHFISVIKMVRVQSNHFSVKWDARGAHFRIHSIVPPPRISCASWSYLYYRRQSANRHKSSLFFRANLKLKTALMRHWFMVSVYAAKLPCQNQIVSFFPRTLHIANYPMKMILVEVIRRTNVRCLYIPERARIRSQSELKLFSKSLRARYRTICKLMPGKNVNANCKYQ